MALTKVKLIADGVVDVDHLAANHGITTDNIGEGTALYYTDARVSSYLTTNSYATEGFVTTAVSNLVASAPSTLDTLNELAAALGDDPNFATTVTNSIAGKLPLTGGTLTGSLTTASPLTIQAASPYIQWKNASGTRLGYIQHNETDLVMSVDTGNIILDGGDVAIGTNPARAKLEVNGENYAVTNSGRSVGGIHISSTNNNGQDTYSGGISFAGPGSGSAAISGVQGTSDGDTQGLAFFTHPSGTGANNNVEYMRLTYDGKLGIGGPNPQDIVNIHNSSANANIGLKITRGTQTHGLRLGVNDAHAFLWTTENQDLAFATNNSPRLTIKNDGSVLINQTSDLTGQSLQVNGFVDITNVDGALRLYNGSTFRGGFGDGQWASGNATYTNDLAVFATEALNLHANNSNTPLVRLVDNKVGIGTATPNTKLQVSGYAPTYTNSSTVFWGSTSNNTSHTAISLTSAGNALTGFVGSNLYWNNSSSPSQTNTARSSGYIQFVNTTVAGKRSTINLGGSVVGSNSISPTMTLNENSHVGIGTTSPSTRFHAYHPTTNVVGTFESGDGDVWVDLRDSAASTYGVLIGAQGGDFRVSPNNNEVFRIKSNGDVGIGTQTPAGKLNTYVSSNRQITHYGNSGDLSVISDNNSQTVFYIKGNGSAPMMSIHDSSKTAFQILGNRNMRIPHGYGDFYQHLGSVGTATGDYYHIRLRTPWDDTGMTMFRITGFHPYGNYAESYMGAYRYPSSVYRSAPYGQINHNQGTWAAAHSQYNTNANPGYLVLVIYWPTSYTGVTVEHIGAGDQYGARMDSSLEIIDYVKTNDTTPQW